MNAAAPWAAAVAIERGKIIAVGADDEVLSHKTARTKIDLHGRLLTPGCIDSHVHFIDGGWYLRNVALRDATTMAEVSRRVAAYAAAHPKTDWIQGEGWSYGYPDLPHGDFAKEIIDKVSAKHPVFLDSSMAHAAWVNSEALRRTGINRDTPNPEGGDQRGPTRGDSRGESAGPYARRQRRRRLPLAALDAYEGSQAHLPAGAPRPRNRVEHMEAPDPEDIPRFGALDVIRSMQPLMTYPRDEWKGMEGLWSS